MSAPIPSRPRQKFITELLRRAGCVFAEDEARILLAAAQSATELDLMITRRIAGEPLEIIVGWAEFCGLRILMEPGVFVPRRRTEFLAEQACTLTPRGGVAVDLCCGSGAVGAVLQSNVPELELYGVDIEPAAVHCAHRNVAPPGHVLDGDLYDPLPLQLRGRIDVIVANAPYVPTNSIHLLPPEARLHESLASLDGGFDGLDIQRRIAIDAATWLKPGGHLLVETSNEQMKHTIETFTLGGLLVRIASQIATSSTVIIGANVTC